jgi:hypothetical protein
VKADPLLPRRAGETDDERRLREALNRLGGQAMQAVDSAIGLRSATSVAARSRHRARGYLVDFCANAMLAFGQASEDRLPPEN